MPLYCSINGEQIQEYEERLFDFKWRKKRPFGFFFNDGAF
jgi:hypothetical protein